MDVYRFVSTNAFRCTPASALASCSMEAATVPASISYMGSMSSRWSRYTCFGSFEAGNLRRAGVRRVHGGIGFNWQHAELFAGYDYLNVGEVELKESFVGLRLWF